MESRRVVNGFVVREEGLDEAAKGLQMAMSTGSPVHASDDNNNVYINISYR